MNICYFGSYHEKYQRNQIIRKGLAQNGVRVFTCNVPFELNYRFWKRYFKLFVQHRAIKNDYDYLFVAEMNHKNMPLAYLLAKLYKKPLIFDPFISFYDTNVNDRRRFKKFSIGALESYLLDRISLKMADMVLADTLQHSYYYTDTFRVSKDKVRIVYVGVDDELFDRDRYNNILNRKKKLVVCFYGSFVPLHGIEDIVRAANILGQEEIEFKFIGQGQTYPMIEALVHKFKISNLTFLPPVPIEELPLKIKEADILLGIFGNSDKTQRVIPNKVFQSLAMGKPVITGDTPAIREVFKDRENILLCKCADENSLARAIMELKENPPLRQRLADNGYALVKEQYTPLALGKKLLQEMRN